MSKHAEMESSIFENDWINGSNNSQFAQTSVSRCEHPRIDECYENDGKDDQISDEMKDR